MESMAENSQSFGRLDYYMNLCQTTILFVAFIDCSKSSKAYYDQNRRHQDERSKQQRRPASRDFIGEALPFTNPDDDMKSLTFDRWRFAPRIAGRIAGADVSFEVPIEVDNLKTGGVPDQGLRPRPRGAAPRDPWVGNRFRPSAADSRLGNRRRPTRPSGGGGPFPRQRRRPGQTTSSSSVSQERSRRGFGSWSSSRPKYGRNRSWGESQEEWTAHGGRRRMTTSDENMDDFEEYEQRTVRTDRRGRQRNRGRDRKRKHGDSRRRSDSRDSRRSRETSTNRSQESSSSFERRRPLDPRRRRGSEVDSRDFDSFEKRVPFNSFEDSFEEPPSRPKPSPQKRPSVWPKPKPKPKAPKPKQKPPQKPKLPASGGFDSWEDSFEFSAELPPFPKPNRKNTKPEPKPKPKKPKQKTGGNKKLPKLSDSWEFGDSFEDSFELPVPKTKLPFGPIGGGGDSWEDSWEFSGEVPLPPTIPKGPPGISRTRPPVSKKKTAKPSVAKRKKSANPILFSAPFADDPVGDRKSFAPRETMPSRYSAFSQNKPCRCRNYTRWSEWSPCSTTCGGCGQQVRSRICVQGECKGEARIQTKRCGKNPCSNGECCAGYALNPVRGYCKKRRHRRTRQ